jgi:AcrR family transcriptional regulator
MKDETTARERILKAAFELISSRGYPGASTREIAQKARVAEVTLFRHFTNKESLFAEVLRSFSTIPALTELLPQLKLLPYEEALETLTLRFLERLEVNRNWIQVLNCEVTHAPEEMKNVYGDFLCRLFGVLTDYFSGALERGVIRDDLYPEHVARAFHSMMFGIFHIEGILDSTSVLIQQRRDMISSFVKIFYQGTQPVVCAQHQRSKDFSSVFV